MTTETLIILLIFVVALAHYFSSSFFNFRRFTVTDLVGPRDNMPPTENVAEQRAARAVVNFKETLPWAIGLLILVQVTGDVNGTTALGGWLYLVGRALYLPLYIMGVPYLRTLVWAASLVGLVMIALQLL